MSDVETVEIRYDGASLVAVVAQDHLTGEVRMVAYANAEAVEKTLATGLATFYSRSRGALWTKGETSGNAMRVVRVLVDCDADCLLYLVEPSGPSCHTGAPSCFFRTLDGVEPVPPTTLLARLEATIEARKAATAEASYVKSLFTKGREAIGDKVREEAAELANAITSEEDARVVSEAADVLFHVMVALASRGVPMRAVLAELSRRAGTSGHDEKRARSSR